MRIHSVHEIPYIRDQIKNIIEAIMTSQKALAYAVSEHENAGPTEYCLALKSTLRKICGNSVISYTGLQPECVWADVLLLETLQDIQRDLIIIRSADIP